MFAFSTLPASEQEKRKELYASCWIMLMQPVCDQQNQDTKCNITRVLCFLFRVLKLRNSRKQFPEVELV